VVDQDLAMISWAMGDKDKAFHHFFRALDKKIPVSYGLYSPIYKGIADDPRFYEIKKRMNLVG
jgi:hypothetical protein